MQLQPVLAQPTYSNYSVADLPREDRRDRLSVVANLSPTTGHISVSRGGALPSVETGLRAWTDTTWSSLEFISPMFDPLYPDNNSENQGGDESEEQCCLG